MVDPPSMSRDQVRSVDAWAIDTLGVAGPVLMENAGRCATDAACRMLAGIDSARVAVLAGSGNNAGDGFVIARHLLIRGIAFDVYLLAPAEKTRGDARINLDILTALQVVPIQWLQMTADAMADVLDRYDLLVDALGGTGIVGPLRGPLAEAVVAANAADTPILAVDIPTGLDCDTGQAHEPTIIAAETVTFVAPKSGFAAPGADRYTGRVTVADIGVPPTRTE